MINMLFIFFSLSRIKLERNMTKHEVHDYIAGAVGGM